MNIQLLPTEAHPVRGRNSLYAPKDKRFMNSQPQSNQQGPATPSNNLPASTSQVESPGGSTYYQNRSDN